MRSGRSPSKLTMTAFTFCPAAATAFSLPGQLGGEDNEFVTIIDFCDKLRHYCDVTKIELCMAGNEQDVPLNAIRAFVAIAREKSVTRAAKELGITQSSVSRYLAVLEEYLGTELLKGRGRGS